jgi:hypothetical protein
MKQLFGKGAPSGVLTLDNVPTYMVDTILRGNASRFMTDAAVAGGMAFLEAELEKRDPKVREPLTSVTWMRDMVCKTGGGFVDYTSTFNVDYGTAGPNQYGIMGGATNNIPIMQANMGKDIFSVWNWMNILRVTFIDMRKAQQVGRSLDDMLDKGIRLNYNKALDMNVYNGVGTIPGLLNNTSITATTAAVGAQGSTSWSQKTPEEILYDFNTAIISTWAASEYDITGMADYILVPPAQYGLLTTRIVSQAGNRSLLDYLLENNIAKNQGRNLQIFPSRWCIGAATTVSGDRMMAYVNDDDRVYFDITVPINRAMTMPDVQQAAYLTLFVGQFGQVKFLYTQPCCYVDGI